MNCETRQPEPRIEFHKLVNGRRAARFAVSQQTADAVELLLCKMGHARERHANGKPVMIDGNPNLEVYELRMAKHGAKPIEDWWFPSADAASRHFGYRYNEVAQALKRAKQRGEEFAVVAGVPVCWAGEVAGVD